MRIKSIKYAGKADVYNMEVEDTHNFSVENGIIVHNCYDELRYMCMENPIKPASARKYIKLPDDPLDLYEHQKFDRYGFYRK